MRRALALAAVSACTAGAAPARAADERPAARQFAFAAYRLRVAILDRRGDVARLQREVGLERCVTEAARAPAGAADRADAIVTLAAFGPLFAPTLPALHRFVDELDAVATGDPVLRSGRAAWRRGVALIAALPVLDDPCGALARWHRAGWSPSAAPAVGLARLRRWRAATDLDGKLARAAARMRALGVGRGAAHRFTGEPLYRGLEPDAGGVGGSSAAASG